MSILVTGGAGYIGSHVVKLLQNQGRDVVVVDDLSSGDPEGIGNAPLVELEISADGAQAELETAMKRYDVDAVIHFAAQKQVGVSIERPTYYYRQNVGGMTNLLAAMESQGVSQLVFSSSAAAYGMLDVDLVTEDMPCNPINPYGETKLIGEWMAARAATATGLRAASLRYFNVAGAGDDSMGDPTSLNVIPIIFNHLVDETRPTVFGDDYATPDGTCVRDYVHVLDLALAHVAALEWTGSGGARHAAFNIGTGRGSSVIELIDEISRVTGQTIQPHMGARRPGDPARVVADVTRAELVLNWKAKQGLPDMVASAWSAFCVRRGT